MPDKWEDETQKDQLESELLMIAGLAVIYDSIRSKAKSVASKWRENAPDENGLEWLNKNNRNAKLAKDMNDATIKDFVKADKFNEKRFADEFPSSYYQSTYPTTQRFRAANYNVNINKFSERQLETALKNSLSKFVDKDLMRADRVRSIDRLYRTVREGISRGESLDKINRNLDKVLGYRDNQTNKLINKPVNYKGDFSRRKTVLRTELNRMRSAAGTDKWINQQKQGIDNELIYQAVKDNRTRPQSANMDGQVAREDGKFQYPDGQYYFQSHTGNPAWDVNDRCYLIESPFPIEEYAEEFDLNKNEAIEPYQSFKQYAANRGMSKNVYGQWVL